MHNARVKRTYGDGVATWIGLALQLVGTALAAAALFAEWRDDATLTPGARRRVASKRDNPWQKPLTNVRLRRVHRHERTDHERRLQTRGPGAAGTHPDTLAVAEYFLQWIRAREDLMTKDWERQLKYDIEVNKELGRIVDEQLRLLREDQESTRSRVRVEMLGLLLVAIGTVISTL